MQTLRIVLIQSGLKDLQDGRLNGTVQREGRCSAGYLTRLGIERSGYWQVRCLLGRYVLANWQIYKE